MATGSGGGTNAAAVEAGVGLAAGAGGFVEERGVYLGNDNVIMGGL